MRPVVALILFALAPLASAQDSKSFEKALESVHKFMEQERWDKAESALFEALEENARAPYVLAQRQLVLENAKRIAFWKDREVPDLETLVAAELTSWKPGAKPKIDLTYNDEKGWDDWDIGQHAVVHPLVFSGPFEIEIKGKSYPWDKPPLLMLCIDGDVSYLAFLGIPPDGKGSYYPGQFYRDVDGKREELDTLDSVPVEVNRPFELHAKVTAKKITIKLNGKKILEGKREKDDPFGQIALDRVLANASIESIRLDGEVTSSWTGNLIDAALQGDRNQFDQSYDPEKHLPGWLFNVEEAAIDRGARRMYPEPFDGAPHRAWKHIPAAIEKGNIHAAIDWLNKLPEDSIPQAHRAFLACILHQQLGAYEEALASCRVVTEADPEYLPARLMEAALVQLRSAKESMEIYKSIAEDFPNTPFAVTPYVQMLLLHEKLGEAKMWASRFASDHPSSTAVSAVQSMLLKAEKGPVFSSPTSYETEHYEVVTDMDREICVDAAQELERMYRAYKLYFRRIPNEQKGRFKVFLFSGKSGFERYAEDVLGGGIAGAAGLYSPVVKQLLIWNLPDRAEMFKTVQHEGFHQYLDRLMPDPPVWLNEGMASYFEQAGFEDGKFQEGQIDRYLAGLLKHQGFADMAHFIRMDNTTFRNPATTGRNYAQGWLFVHYMRNSNTENKRLFDNLIDRLCESESGHEVVEEVLGGLDLKQLQADMEAHLDSLGV